MVTSAQAKAFPCTTSLPDNVRQAGAGRPAHGAGRPALIISAEDGAADTIVPHFLRAGGAPKQARIMNSDRLFVTPDDLDKLERAIRQVGVSFVTIDSIMCFLSDGVNSTETRTLGGPCSHWWTSRGARVRS